MSPEILPDDIAALRALVLAAQAERDAERAEKARLIDERDQLAGQKLAQRFGHYRRGLTGLPYSGVTISGVGRPRSKASVLRAGGWASY